MLSVKILFHEFCDRFKGQIELSNLAYSQIPNPIKIIFLASEIKSAEGSTDTNIDHAFILSPFCKYRIQIAACQRAVIAISDFYS